MPDWPGIPKTSWFKACCVIRGTSCILLQLSFWRVANKKHNQHISYIHISYIHISYIYTYIYTHTYIHALIHTYILRMGTRLQHDICSHVYSHYPSTAKGSLLPPLWLKYHCRSPEKTIANAEAVHLLLSLWLRTDHSCINKEHIHIGENLRFTGYQP